MIAKLDDLDLVLLKHKTDDPSSPVQELRTILRVWTTDKRSIVEHKVPGKEGSVLQDLGKHALRFAFLGEFIGPDAKNATQTLWGKFRQGKSLPFTSEIVALSDVNKVVIEQLDFEDLAGDVDHFRYHIVLREYTEPPPAEEEAPAQSDEAEENVEDETEDAAESINYVTGKVIDTDKNPVKDAKVIIKGEPGEFEVQTDENGVYRKDDLKPGKYEVKVDAPGYEDQKKEVEIKAEAGEGGEEKGEEE